ncbi:MAG TPA: S41 family peptidase [Blastocatellia bacterium]|nr:S41 family peptidase [Blastocatellia bacterium]
MKKLTLLVWVGALLVMTAAAQERPEARLRLQSFEIVWSKVKEKHFDPTFGGLDWEAVRRRYEPRVAQAKDDREFYRLLNEMLGELQQSHFTVIAPEAILDDGSAGSPSGSIGIDLQILDDQAVVTRVRTGSAAARAGLRTGFIIKRIDGAEAASLQKEAASRAEQRNWLPSFKRRMVARNLLNRIGGRPGTVVRLQYLGEDTHLREVAIERELQTGELSQPLGNFPAILTEFEKKRLANGLGYIRFNYFMMPVMEKVRTALREFKDAPGIIFDLRGNGGGVAGLAPGIVGYLESKPASLGTSLMRTGQIKYPVFPQDSPYTGALAVLIDGGSGSTTEIFAAGLQELRRAVIVGERSAGLVLPSIFEKLPTGALLQYAFADFRTPSGVTLEGRGVTPDLEVQPERAALLAGHDPQLDAAVEAVVKRSNR